MLKLGRKEMGGVGCMRESGGLGCAMDLLHDHSSLSLSGSWFPRIHIGIYLTSAVHHAPGQVCHRYA